MDARQQREKDFTLAIRQHRAAMYRVARAMLGRDADAEDAVSAAKLRDWNKVRPWLIRITINACHDTLRKRKREAPMADAAARLDVLCAPEETPIWMYLERLSPTDASLLAMRFSEGMSLEEICEALRLSKGTVSSRLTRAKQALAQQMKQEVTMRWRIISYTINFNKRRPCQKGLTRAASSCLRTSSGRKGASARKKRR